MKRVIDISEDAYELLLEKGTCGKFANLGEIVANSTPLEQEPTTKNDLTEQCIACKYDETEDESGEHCKKCLEGDSQFELDNDFVQPTTKNDLGVDLISRADVLQILLDYDYANENALVLKDIKALSSVSSQEPIMDKIIEIIEPLRHLSIDEMSNIEWQIFQVIDKYKAESNS